LTQATDDLDYPFHSRPETKEDDGQDGVTVRHQLIIEAVRSICMGPLALKFVGDPTGLGAFAAAIADGVEEEAWSSGSSTSSN